MKIRKINVVWYLSNGSRLLCRSQTHILVALLLHVFLALGSASTAYAEEPLARWMMFDSDADAEYFFDVNSRIGYNLPEGDGNPRHFAPSALSDINIMTVYKAPLKLSRLNQNVKYEVTSYSMNCVSMTYAVKGRVPFADGNIELVHSDQTTSPAHWENIVPKTRVDRIARIDCAPYRHMR